MRIMGSDGYYLRQIKAKDAISWAEIFIDWPADDRGGRSVARGIAEADYHLKRLGDFHSPLTEDSRFELVMMYCGPDDAAIGVYRVDITGKHYQILNYAIHPDSRGQGLSSRMTHCWNWFSEFILDADYAEFDVFADAPGALANAHKFSSAEGDAMPGRRTGRQVIPSRIDRAGVDAQRATATGITTYEVLV